MGAVATFHGDVCVTVYVCLRTLPPPYWEHHKPPNVTPSGSVEKQGREEASASASGF